MRGAKEDVRLFKAMFGDKEGKARAEILYARIVAAARDPHWYVAGGVPDTIDGRFDMIAALLALVMLRLEADGGSSRAAVAALAECFVDDMEGSLRQIGIGDLVVGKHVGRMMSALGGRLGAFRDALTEGDDLMAPVRRNIFHEAPPSDEALHHVVARLGRFRGRLEALPAAELAAGALPEA